ncbi:polyprenyl synthetase family protein [Lysinibacter sp. HNR]|uniref:polyprenyl synthetase family protein n=1 Tax=Lysinibacter sp. HNR TaxID=3031408 RepID=UPI002435FE83|nr:polyprenyl synthetase family protein [Lysinibacter sp. HNR]WGD36408.1 polyprenyl synthetase family protein [Lysinibacter sp. HNR]
MKAAATDNLAREKLRGTIKHELAEIFARQSAAAQAYGSEFSKLWSIATQHVLGGKLVRPVLMMETYDALVEDNPSQQATDRSTVLRIATAIEILHYSFLLHDDVIDGDLFRRGRRNLIGTLLDDGVNRLYGEVSQKGREDTALHWARTGGILMGDLLLAATHQLFARAEVPQKMRLKLLDLLEHSITESVAGEQLDVGLSDGLIMPDLSTVLAMSTHKTATYTFELPLRTAAIIAGTTQELENSLAMAGRYLGLAFQLQDDLISTFGDSEVHGKDAFSDLRERKQTTIISYARTTSTWPSIEANFENPKITVEVAERIRSLLDECGAKKFVRSLIEEQTSALYEVLVNAHSAHSIPPGARRLLLSYASELKGRAA